MGIMMPDISVRMPLSGFCDFLNKGSNEIRNPFDDFVTLHTVIFQKQKTLMPTFMIVYEDETFALKSFHASIKTTMYRTINDIVKKIKPDKIKSIFLVTEMLKYTNEKNDYWELLKINSNDRAKYKTSELLCFYMLDKNLHFQSHIFDSERIDDMEYIALTLKKQSKEKYISFFLQPIKDEFKRISIEN